MMFLGTFTTLGHLHLNVARQRWYKQPVHPHCKHIEAESTLAAFPRGEYNVFRALKRRENRMTTMTVRMSDEDAELVRKYVGFEGTTISEFARSAMLEKIEDHADLQELRAAIEADDGQRFSINDVLEELD